MVIQNKIVRNFQKENKPNPKYSLSCNTGKIYREQKVREQNWVTGRQTCLMQNS